MSKEAITIRGSKVSFRLSCLRPFSTHAKSRSRALSTVYFQGIFTAIMYIVHVATFGQVVPDETMFHLKRTVVDYTSMNVMFILETYESYHRRGYLLMTSLP